MNYQRAVRKSSIGRRVLISWLVVAVIFLLIGLGLGVSIAAKGDRPEQRKEESMTLGDVLNVLSNREFLLTVTGVCDGWYGGADRLKKEKYYITYKDRMVENMTVLLTNGIPELSISLKEE